MTTTAFKAEEHTRPMSLWAYIGYTLLFCIPVVGQVALIVFSIIGGNVNRRNYARALLILLIVFILLMGLMINAVLRDLDIKLKDSVASIKEKLRAVILAVLEGMHDLVKNGFSDVPPKQPPNPTPTLAPAGA